MQFSGAGSGIHSCLLQITPLRLPSDYICVPPQTVLGSVAHDINGRFPSKLSEVSEVSEVTIMQLKPKDQNTHWLMMKGLPPSSVQAYPDAVL